MDGDVLIVWSLLKKELYAFEGVGAAIFLYMETYYPQQKREYVYSYFDKLSKRELEPLIEQISTILYDVAMLSSNDKIKQKMPQHKRLSKQWQFAKRYILELNEECFTLELEDTTLEDLVMPSLQHLQKHTQKSDFTISIVKNRESGYEIYVDSKLEDNMIKRENLLPVLYDRIRIYHYQRNPFLVALHAAVLHYNDTTLIFPGISGAGKSTLAAYLMYKGFTLFSDELTIIDENKTFTPLPLGVTLKEASWHIIEPFTDTMVSMKTHLRFDNQKIKFVLPPKIVNKKYKAKKMIFIFPQFIQGSATQLEPLSLVTVLENFIDAGYHLCNPNDFEKVLLWLNILSEAKLYSLEYSNIEEAYTIMKKVIH